jgi:hypothetical protein
MRRRNAISGVEMRRAIAIAVSGGLLLGGAAAAEGVATAAGAATASTRIVVYAGYQFAVPASWPVYRLDQDPAACVRYDVHAVYLGAPGADQQCPAGLLGRTETVTIVAAPGSSAGRAVVALDAEDHQVQVTLARDGRVRATVLATYGGDLALIRRVLATVRPAVGPGGQAEQAGLTGQAGREELAGLVQQATTAWRGPPAPAPQYIIEPPPVPVLPRRPVRGFDACTAPPLAAMKAWRGAYSAVGIYIGGVNSACAGGNLSASWIGAAAKMGWSMLPTYVGPQAPCLGYGTAIGYSNAAREGAAAASDAALDARRYGLRTGSPIYYDMEGYIGSSACTSAVLDFLGAWTRELNAEGYVSGVYSSWDSAIADMEQALARNQGFAPPQAVWYALWDGQGNLSGRMSWAKDERDKQFLGPHNATIGGYTLNIDTDIVGGPVAS